MKKKKTEAVFSWLRDHCHHVSGIRQTYAGLLLLKPRRLAQAAVWEHERLCGMSRRTGPNSGPHCQGSWQQTPIVGQGKEFGYIFQRGPQLQTNWSNRLLSKPFCPHSNLISCERRFLGWGTHSHLTDPKRRENMGNRNVEGRTHSWTCNLSLPAEINPTQDAGRRRRVWKTE